MSSMLEEERRMLRDMLRDLLSRNEKPAEVWAALADAGVFRALLPVSAGGLDGSSATISLVFEEFGRAASCLPVLESVLLGGSILACNPDLEDLVATVVDGSRRVAFAYLDSPTARYEMGNSMLARGDHLSGAKYMALGGEDADWLIVTAEDGMYLVARDVPGMSSRGYTLLDGSRAADLFFDRSPAIRICGTEDRTRQLWIGLMARAAQMMGGIERVQEMTIDYLKSRQQFGRPLAGFQALSHRLADMAVEIEQSRSALVNLANHMGADDLTLTRYAAAAKNLLGRTASMMVEESIQMHGGMGVSAENPLSRHYRCLLTQLQSFGDTDFHLELFARSASPGA